MDLVVDQMVQLEVVHDAYGYRVVERLSGSSVVEYRLAVYDAELIFYSQLFKMSRVGALVADYRTQFTVSVVVNRQLEQLLAVDVFIGQNLSIHARLDHALRDIRFGRAVEYRRHYLPAELLRGKT